MSLELDAEYEFTPVLSQFSFKGKIAVLTRGFRGIGLKVNSTGAAETATAVERNTGQRIRAYQSDVMDKTHIAKSIRVIAEEFGNGRVDIIVANVGVCANVSSLDVNYDGVMWAALAAIQETGRGAFTIAASVSTPLVNVSQKQASYNASKAGVLQLARSLAVEWADFARVNFAGALSPGYVLTETSDACCYMIGSSI
ncbi:hypothetical protein F4805DRAFT_468953 [Annulohypoxylon moriforme]|nr:hypothetical protein F4805DRAFT_468953 [Annulohypoxylon moriforme]